MALTESGLFCPQSYLDAPLSVRKSTCNGCGPATAKFDFVPDTVWGLSIEHACYIHDWMYGEGNTIDDKEQADRVFLNNILRLIENRHKSGGVLDFILKALRRRRALKYYEAVHIFGGPAFWKGKN